MTESALAMMTRDLFEAILYISTNAEWHLVDCILLMATCNCTSSWTETNRHGACKQGAQCTVLLRRATHRHSSAHQFIHCAYRSLAVSRSYTTCTGAALQWMTEVVLTPPAAMRLRRTSPSQPAGNPKYSQAEKFKQYYLTSPHPLTQI